MNSDSNTFYLEIAGRLTAQSITITRFPTRVGRSPDCDITLNDQTIAPVQFIVDKNENGDIFVENKAEKTDNPTKLNGKILTKNTLITDDSARLSIGRLAVKLRRGRGKLAKTIQLRPPGWLGWLTMPIIAMLLLFLLGGIVVYNSYLGSVKAFEPTYKAYFEVLLAILVLLCYCVFIHTMRVRFSLVVFSLSIITITTLTYQLLPHIIGQLEYWLNINTDNLLFYCSYAILTFTIWFWALQKKLHLSGRKALIHTILVCLPILINTFSSVVIQGIAARENYIKGKFNGQIEPYNWHREKTQSLDAFFIEANGKLRQ